MTPLFKIGCFAVALSVAGCSLQRVSESAHRAEKDADEASQYTAISRNQQPVPRRDTVVFSDKPWVSTQPVVAKSGLPPSMDCELVYRPTAPVSITTVAQYVASQCGFTVLVSPDAVNPGLNSSGPSAQEPLPGAAAQNPDSLDGLMPVGVVGGANQQGSGNPARGFGFSNASGPSLIPDIKYSGRASGLLDLSTARLGLSWHYSDIERAARINYFETKVFDVYTFGDKQVIESTVKSGMTTSAGTGSASSGGSGGGTGGTGSTSGVSGESGSNQSTNVHLESNLLGDIEKTVRSMLSTSPAGRLYMSSSTGTLTVTDRPEVLARVEKYLNITNHSITQQVLFNVKVVEVTLTDQDQLDLNWSAVYKSLSNKWGLSLTNTVPGGSTSAITGSIGIVDTANSAFAGSKAIIQALAEQGRISDVRSPSVTTLNLQPAPIQIGRINGYIAGSTTTNTAQVGSSSSLSPASITSGYNMTLLPRVMDQNEMLVMISINMTSKPTFEPFTSNGASAQVPEYDAKSLSPKVKLRSGQTLILSGFDESTEDSTKIGIGSPSFFGLGGGQNRTSTHSVLVVLITPILLGQASNDAFYEHVADISESRLGWAA